MDENGPTRAPDILAQEVWRLIQHHKPPLDFRGIDDPRLRLRELIVASPLAALMAREYVREAGAARRNGALLRQLELALAGAILAGRLQPERSLLVNVWPATKGGWRIARWWGRHRRRTIYP